MPTGSLKFSGLSLNLSNSEKVADETETENIKERDVFSNLQRYHTRTTKYKKRRKTFSYSTVDINYQ